MPDQAMVVADTNGVIRLWNAGAEALFAMTRRVRWAKAST
jgi:hypothetical protein